MNEKRVTKGFMFALLALLTVVAVFFWMPFYPINDPIDSILPIIILATGWGFALASLVYFLKIEEDKNE